MQSGLFTAIYAALIAFTANLIIGPLVMPYLRRIKAGQNVREDGPKSHLSKAGTLTMGGVIIIFSFCAGALFYLRGNTQGLMIMFAMAGFGLVGFLDDYIKLVKKRSLGLRAYQKIIGQLAVTAVFVAYLWLADPMIFGSGISRVLIPFTNGLVINLGPLYIPFAFFVIIGCVNGVNITDGLDGLACGVTLLVTVFLVFCAAASRSPILPVLGAGAGALMGFLLFNAYPAKVFMGDTGSLALGGFVAASAILLKMPLFLVIIGIIYVTETLSVFLQVSYFKLTGGRRLFKMAPIHHSFELSGWHETRVVTLFYVITAVACLVGFLGARFIFE